MKKRIIFIGILLTFLFLNACAAKDPQSNNKNVQNKTKKENLKRITKEDLINEYHITEEELDGVDVISFLSITDIEPGIADEAYVRDALEFFKEEFNNDGYMDYGYMLEESANNSITPNNANDIVKIVWQKNVNELSEALAFDFENERIYEGYRIESFNQSQLIGATDNTMKEQVIQLLDTYDIYNWKDFYQGESMEGTTGSYNWQMAIEFSDGTLWQTGGNGNGDNAQPKNMKDFITALRNCESQDTSLSE